ncbi:ABC transporter permease subunit [Clostridium sp. CTA-19]
MGGLILNEFNKMKCKKKFIIVILLIFILEILALYASVKNTNSDKIKLYINEPSIKQQMMDTQFRIDEVSKIQNREENLYKKENLEKQMEILEKQQSIANDMKCSKIKWRELLENDLELIKEKKILVEKEGVNDVIEEVNREFLYKDYCLNRNVKYEIDKKPTAFYNYPSVIYYVQRIFLLLIVAIFVCDIVSNEMDAMTIKVLLSKPVSRSKILLSKFFTAILVTNMIIIGIQFLGFLVFGVLYGFGDLSTPFLVGGKYSIDYNLISNGKRAISSIIGSSYIMPAWKIIISMILAQSILVTATISFCFLISTICKNSIASTSIGFFLLVISFIVTFNSTDIFSSRLRPSIIQKILPYVFGSYYDTFSIFTGQLAKSMLNPIATIECFTIISILWIVICYTISNYIFIKRDII